MSAMRNVKPLVVGGLIRRTTQCSSAVVLQHIWAMPRSLKHEDEGASPQMAKRLEAMLRQAAVQEFHRRPDGQYLRRHPGRRFRSTEQELRPTGRPTHNCRDRCRDHHHRGGGRRPGPLWKRGRGWSGAEDPRPARFRPATTQDR